MAKVRKPREGFQLEDLNLQPIMNLVCILIPFLLLCAAFVQYASINVSSPRFGSAATRDEERPPDEKPPLNLTVFITDEGFRIAARGGVLGGSAGADTGSSGPSIRKKGEDYDYEGLTKKLREIKDLPEVQEETNVIIGAEPDIKYDVIIKAMDACRRDDKGKLLFPDVTISTGIA